MVRYTRGWRAYQQDLVVVWASHMRPTCMIETTINQTWGMNQMELLAKNDISCRSVALYGWETWTTLFVCNKIWTLQRMVAQCIYYFNTHNVCLSVFVRPWEWDVVSLHTFRQHQELLLASCSISLTSSLLEWKVVISLGSFLAPCVAIKSQWHNT